MGLEFKVTVDERPEFWLLCRILAQGCSEKGVSFEMKVQGLLSKMLAFVAQNLGMGFGF